MSSAELQIELGQPALLTLLLANGATGKFPQAKVYDEANAVVATVDLVHVADGLYRAPTTLAAVGAFTVVYSTFDDAGHTQPSAIEKASDVVIVGLPPDLVRFAASYDAGNDEMRVSAWLTRRGAQVADVQSCIIDICSPDGTILFSLTDSAPDVVGVFTMTRTVPGLQGNSNYTARVRVTCPTHVVDQRCGFKTVA